jgi:hypothetical protein
MSLEYRRLFLPGYITVWQVIRNREWIGTAAQLAAPRRWQAALPDRDGTYLLDEDGCPMWLRTRSDVTLRLAMLAEGIAP